MTHSSLKRILALVIILSMVAFSLEAFAGGRGGGKGGSVDVRGYTRKDGTYVAPHQRSAPDGNPTNNYGMPGNYNPNKDAITPGDPDKYLERYYEKKGGYSWPKTGTND